MALVAVAVLNLASVQSTVMQATGPRSGVDLSLMAVAEICHAAAPSHNAAKPAIHPVPAQYACPFCEVAANPPLCGGESPVPTPATIAWTTYTVQTALGARGPPAIAPNARGPPSPIPTI